MSGNVLTEDRVQKSSSWWCHVYHGTSAAVTRRMMEPQHLHPSWRDWRWSVCKLQCQMAEDYFHFFPWILHVARIQPTLGGNIMTHSLLFWSVQQILCIFICGVFKVNLIELVAMWEEVGYIVPLSAPTPAPISPPPGFTRRISTFAFRRGGGGASAGVECGRVDTCDFV